MECPGLFGRDFLVFGHGWSKCALIWVHSPQKRVFRSFSRPATNPVRTPETAVYRSVYRWVCRAPPSAASRCQRHVRASTGNARTSSGCVQRSQSAPGTCEHRGLRAGTRRSRWGRHARRGHGAVLIPGSQG